MSFYESREWRKLRHSTLRKYGYKCMACHTERAEIHVDHIKPRSKHPELELDVESLQVLCRDCNLGKGNEFEDDLRPDWAKKESQQRWIISQKRRRDLVPWTDRRAIAYERLSVYIEKLSGGDPRELSITKFLGVLNLRTHHSEKYTNFMAAKAGLIEHKGESQ